MNAGVFWSEVRRVRHVLAEYQRLRDEIRPPRPHAVWGRRFAFWGLPLQMALVPYGGLVLLSMFLFSYSIMRSPMRLNSFEALRMPSRRALYVARLMDLVPWAAWLGLAMVLNVSLWSTVLAHPDPTAAAAVLLCVALTPFIVIHGAGMFIVGAGPKWQQLRLWALILVVIATVLAWPYQPLIDGIHEPLGVCLVRLAVMTLSAAGFLVAQFWAAGRVEPLRQMQLGFAGDTVPHVLQTKPQPFRRQDAGLGPPGPLAGRHGLFWAAVYRHAAKVRRDWLGVGLINGALITFTLVFIWLTTSPSAEKAGDASDWLPGVAWSWMPWLGMVWGSVLALPDPQRLYLFGVNYRTQMLHRLRTFWMSYALVVVAVPAVIQGVLSGQWSGSLAVVGATLGLLLFRSGCCEWPGYLWPRWFWAVSGRVLLVVLSALVLNVPAVAEFLRIPLDDAQRMWLFAGVATAFGLGGWVWKLVRCDEATLAAAQQGRHFFVTG